MCGHTPYKPSWKVRFYVALSRMDIVLPLEFIILVVSVMFGASAGVAAHDPTLGNPLLFGIQFTLFVAIILAISDVILFLFLFS